MSVFLWIIIGLLIFLAIAALAEARDYYLIFKQPSIDQVNPEEKERQTVFYACSAYENGVLWREAMIPSILLTFILSYVIYVLGVKVQIWLILLILVLAFVLFYGMLALRSYHYHRVVCSKVRKDMIVL